MNLLSFYHLSRMYVANIGTYLQTCSNDDVVHHLHYTSYRIQMSLLNDYDTSFIID